MGLPPISPTVLLAAIPSSDTSFSIRPSMVLDPGRLLCAHPIVHNIIGFQLQDSLALCVCRISRLNPFTCVIGERYLSPGSSRFVASPPAGFCSDVVVSLSSGWILPTRLCQLSWRTSSRAAPTTRAGRPPHRTVRAGLPHTARQQDGLHFCY